MPQTFESTARQALNTCERDTATGSLFRRYRLTQDITLRARLIHNHLPLVRLLAKRFADRGEPIEDLIQEGTIGLMHAIEQFNPDLGIKFNTYATHRIVGQIRHYLRDCGHLIRRPAWVQELNSRIARIETMLTQQLGRDPLPTEIAEYANLSEEAIHEVLAVRVLMQTVSLDTPGESTEETEYFLIDQEKIRNKRYETLCLPIEDRIIIEEAIARLRVIEQQVVRLFFYDNLKQSEIANKLGISANHSSYLLKRSVQKIKVSLNEQAC